MFYETGHCTYVLNTTGHVDEALVAGGWSSHITVRSLHLTASNIGGIDATA